MPTIAQTGFFACVDFTHPLKLIRYLGFKPGANISTPPGIFVVQPPAQLIWPNGDSQQPQIRTAFEAFLQTLYGAGATLSSDSVSHDLNSSMVTGGVLSQYAGVQVVDFMAFCGAISRQQTLPDGTQVDCLNIAPGAPRPLMRDLERKNNNLMFSIIRHIGIQGILPYLYARDGITFKDFCDELRIWKPEKNERAGYVYAALIGILRSERAPVLTEAQINELIK